MKYIDQFEIEDLGVQELDVYDIEVDDNHNFFANDILVHNSVYFSMTPMLDQYGKAETIEDKLAFINKGIDKVILPKIEKNDAEIMSGMNVYKQTLFMNREVIAQSAIFLEKKKYACYIKDDEGIVLDEPKIKVKGFEIVRTSTPQVIRNKLKDTLKVLLDGATEDELKKHTSTTLSKSL